MEILYTYIDSAKSNTVPQWSTSLPHPKNKPWPQTKQTVYNINGRIRDGFPKKKILYTRLSSILIGSFMVQRSYSLYYVSKM